MPKKLKFKILLLTIFLVLGTWIISGCGADKPKEAGDPVSEPAVSAPSSAPGSVETPAENPQTPDEKEIISGLIAKGQEVTEMSYDMVMIGAGLSFDSKVWVKENMLKTDSVINGQRFISIFDLSQGELFSYLPGDQMAAKIKIEEYQGQDNATPLDYLEQLATADFRPAGSEKVNGLECRIVTVISVDGSYKLWLSEEYGIVVKVEGDLDGQGVTIEYKNIKIGEGTVPGDTFLLPEGMEIFDPTEIIIN